MDQRLDQTSVRRNKLRFAPINLIPTARPTGRMLGTELEEVCRHTWTVWSELNILLAGLIPGEELCWQENTM